jgi:hypothetical protein
MYVSPGIPAQVLLPTAVGLAIRTGEADNAEVRLLNNWALTRIRECAEYYENDSCDVTRTICTHFIDGDRPYTPDSGRPLLLKAEGAVRDGHYVQIGVNANMAKLYGDWQRELEVSE